MKKFRLMFLLLFGLSCLCSCNDAKVYKQDLQNDMFKTAEITGNLTHVTYWDSHDKWDLSYLKIKIVYISGLEEEIPFLTEGVSFELTPEIPSKGVNSFEIIDCKIINFKNNDEILIPSKKFYVGVGEYPYANSTNDYANIAVSLAIIAFAIIGFSIYALKRE